jgi:hypothetical protein
MGWAPASAWIDAHSFLLTNWIFNIYKGRYKINHRKREKFSAN